MFAQDIITFTNGEQVKAKVLEVGENEIKYQKFENSGGPTYTKSIKSIFKVKYANGQEDTFNKSTVVLDDQLLISSRNEPTTLLAKGNSVFVEIPNEASRAGEKYFKEALTTWGNWEVVNDVNLAHFIIEFNIEKRPMLDKSTWAIFKTREGKEFKTSKKVRVTTNAFNGYNAFKGAAEKLVDKYFVSGDYLK